MKYFQIISGMAPICVTALALIGCSADQVEPGGKGGASGAAGQPTGQGGSGGAVGKGGSGGMVGNGGSGGMIGNGGTNTGSGGTSGTLGTGTGGTAGMSSGGATASGGAGTGGAAGAATGGSGMGGTAGVSAGGRGEAGSGNGGRSMGGAASGAAGTGTAGTGTAGTGSVMPMGNNSVAYIGCSMAYNIGTGYKRVGGKVMWNSDSYQTSAMVVQNWTDSGSSSWSLFDQKISSIGGKDTVKAIMIQICIFSSRATDAELRSMVASARKHVNAGTHIYMVGQPQYEAGHECSLAGTGGAKWTDDQAKALAADSSVNQDMTYLGQFIIDSTKGEVSSDSCHATTSGEDELGKQAMAFFGG